MYGGRTLGGLGVVVNSASGRDKNDGEYSERERETSTDIERWTDREIIILRMYVHIHRQTNR